MKNLLTKLKTLAVAGITMGLALGAQAEEIPVTGVSLDVTATNLMVGGSFTLTATVVPENASNKAVIWSSERPMVATVSSNGVVTALAAGLSYISVATVDGGYAATNTVAVKLAVHPIPTCPDYASLSNIVSGSTDPSLYNTNYYEYGSITNCLVRMVTSGSTKGQKGYAQDVFLGGEHIDLGLHRNGAFGTKTKPNAKQVHVWTGQQNTFGMRASMTGWGDKNNTATNSEGYVVYMCPKCGYYTNRTEKVKTSIRCPVPECHEIGCDKWFGGKILQNDVGGTLTRDFVTPGTKDEGWLVTTGGTFNAKNNLVGATDAARGQQGYTSECNGLNLVKGSTALSAKVYYKGNGGEALPRNTNMTLIAHTELETDREKAGFKITQVVQFQKYDTGFDTWVTISNMTDTTKENVCYFRGFDIDNPTKWYQDSKYNTDNFYWSDPETHDAWVICAATNYHLPTITTLEMAIDRACTPFFYYAPDPRDDPQVAHKYTITPVTMSVGWMSSKSFSTPDNGYRRFFNTGMGIRFNIGDLGPGESVRLYYYSSLDPCVLRGLKKLQERVKTPVYLTPQDVANATVTNVAVNTDLASPPNDWNTIDPEPDGSYKVWSNNLVRVTYKANEDYVFGDSLTESNIVFTAATDPASVPTELLPVAVPLIEIDVDAPEHTTAAVYKKKVDPANLVKDGKVVTNGIAYVVYTIKEEDEDWYFRGWTKAVTNTLDTTVNPAVDTNDIPVLIDVTWVRTAIKTDTTITNGLYRAVPSTKNGGAFYVAGYTLTGTNVTFSDNIAPSGGAIFINWNVAVKMNGTFTLAMAGDTIQNNGTLIWNLADGNKGCLAGYENLVNDGTLQIAIGGDTLAEPTNIVIATGDFSDIASKDTFTITNVSSASSFAVMINGGGVGDENLACGLRLVEEEPAGSGKTNLVLSAFVPVCRIISADKTTTNYYETVAAAAKAVKNKETVQFLRSAEIDDVTINSNPVTIDLNGQFITNKYLTVNGGVYVKNSVNDGGLVNVGTVEVENFLDFVVYGVKWGKGGLIQSPDGSGKFLIMSDGEVTMYGLSPNWMEANAPGCFSGSATGAKVFISDANRKTVKYTKTDSGIWATDDAVASTKVASTGSYGQGTIWYDEVFTDLQKAIDSVTTNGTVTVLKDIMSSKTFSVTNDYACTLNLNGKSLIEFTSAGDGYFFAVRSPLTIFDSADGTGIQSLDCAAITAYTNLYIKSGYLEPSDCNAIDVKEGAKVYISGGYIHNGYTTSANVFISGGTFAKVKPDESNIDEGFVCYQKQEGVWQVTQGVKLSNVNIFGTSNIVTVAGFPFDAENNEYLVPSNQAVTITYKATDDYMIGPGWTEKTITLAADKIGADYDMTEDPLKASVAGKTQPRWVDGEGGREFALDTRERIVVGTPMDVLPIAYSTNHWGDIPGGAVTLKIQRESDPAATLVDESREDGYADWQPILGAFGHYNALVFIDMDGNTSQDFYYSQPYPLTVNAAEEGGTIAVITNGAPATGTFDVLGYEYVNLKATPESEKWQFTKWEVTMDLGPVPLFWDETHPTNKFEMPEAATTVSGGFVIAEAYRTTLFNEATNSYVKATNAVEQLRDNRLTSAETDAVLMNALSAFNIANGSLSSATKPYEADAATNTLANALAEYAGDAKTDSDAKPYDLVIADDFTAIADNGKVDEDGTFTVNAIAFQTNVNAFTSFTAAYAEKTYVPYVTNVYVFGRQTIMSEPTQVLNWNLFLIPSTDAEGNDVPAVLTVEKNFDDDNDLISITNTLVSIDGEGTIVISKTVDDVKPTIYDAIKGEKIVVKNVGTEPKKSGDDIEIKVDDGAQVEEAGNKIILPGTENLVGDITINIMADNAATNDVVIAGKTEAPNGKVTIKNATTNALTIAGEVIAAEIMIKNTGKTDEAEGKIIAEQPIVASGDVTINNDAHFEANVTAGGKLTIYNGSLTTLVGTYQGAEIELLGDKPGALSNVTFVSEGPVTMKGENVITGPFAIEAPTGAITNYGTLAWGLKGTNHVAYLEDFAEIEQVPEPGIDPLALILDLEQEVGNYVLAGNAADADGLTFQVSDDESGEPFELVVNGENVDRPAGERVYWLKTNEAGELYLMVCHLRTRFDETQYEVVEGSAVKVYVWGGASDKAVQATVTYQKNTGAYSAAYVDGKKVTFPLTLSWDKGDVSKREILFQTAASSREDGDKFFTLQLGSPVGEDVLHIGGEIDKGADTCTVTIKDAQKGAVTQGYVRALAWPANGGTVTGGGTLANAKSYRTLSATTKNGSLLAGWYKAQEDNSEVIDLTAPVAPYSDRNPKQIRVGYDSTAKETINGAGTYFAYFTNVLEVAGVVEPMPFNEAGQAAEGVAGVTGWDDVNCVYSMMVGVKFALPVTFTDGSGKGKLTVSKLPNGLAYSAKTGRIEGVPTKAGTYESQFVASNAAGKHTVSYTFEVAEIPTVAVGTFAGVISDDTNRTGVGSVQFTAGKTGSLSAKVVRRLSGTRSFSVKGYDYIDENTLGVAMTNSYKEVFEAKLTITNGWYDTAVEGSAFGGDPKKLSLAKNGETNGTFVAVRNAFSNTDKDPAAQQILAAFNGTYAENLYATNGIGEAVVGDPVGTVQYRVNAQGSVYVAAKLAKTSDGTKQVSARSISGTVTAGFTYDDETGLGRTAAALRNGNCLWSTEVLLGYKKGGVVGWARYIRPNAEDKEEVVDVDEAVGNGEPAE